MTGRNRDAESGVGGGVGIGVVGGGVGGGDVGSGVDDAGAGVNEET